MRIAVIASGPGRLEEASCFSMGVSVCEMGRSVCVQ